MIIDIDEFPAGYQLKPGEWLCSHDYEAFIVHAESAAQAAELTAEYCDADSEDSSRVKVGDQEYLVEGRRKYTARKVR